MTSRAWILTIRNYEPLRGMQELPRGVTFLVGQLEAGGTTGYVHFQGYVEVDSPRRHKGVLKLLGVGTGNHAEARRGTQEQAIEYCTKPETRQPADDEIPGFSLRLGEPAVGQGTRTDVHAFYAAVKRGLSDRELLEDEGLRAQAVKFQKQLGWIRNTLAEPRSSTPTVWIFWGPTGTGKSHRAFDIAKNNGGSFFVKVNGTKWFDGLTSTTRVSPLAVANPATLTRRRP